MIVYCPSDTNCICLVFIATLQPDCVFDSEEFNWQNVQMVAGVHLVCRPSLLSFFLSFFSLKKTSEGRVVETVRAAITQSEVISLFQTGAALIYFY